MAKRDGRLKGKVALITGAAHGIGEAAARLMAGEGAKVVIADLDIDAARALAGEIREGGGEAAAVFLDALDASSIRDAVAAARDLYGALSILYNNVGGTDATRDNTVVDLDWSYWSTAMALNLDSSVLACRAAIPIMIQGGGGSIINTTSMVAVKGDVRPTAYACAKAGVISFTRFVAAQYGRSNVRCNAVAPGLILTARKVERPQAVLDIFARHTLVPYHGKAEDVAWTALFLASDEARFITGQTLEVDGGMHCHNPTLAELAELQASGVRRQASAFEENTCTGRC